MVHDQASDCFLPAFYVLCSSKELDMYWNVIDHVIQATDQKLNPAKVICDFESGLIKAILTQFPDAKVSGCYFHIKQALGRQTKKLQIPAPKIKIAMAPGGVDVLAVVDKDKVAVQGTAYVRKLIHEECVAEGLTYTYHKWESFWSYFNRQWVRRYDPDLWNVEGMSKQVVARTTNPLERFNRELNGTFRPHPSLPVFVSGIEALARRHVQTLQDIPSNRAKSPRRREKYTLPQKVTFPSK
ncbi:unnamed protein product [Phytophthora fragariaefolia]|uniref:Unnamed protein product n=1 Tax=Phytophthora fragariaefolia TaxID=1490495 RepID=A0A9W6WRE0_9STRA|nr:unnamed protein product [Phytophthora fragariaefolia]